MKFVNLFLALYFMLLAGIPCSDQETCVEESIDAVGQNIFNGEHPEGDVDFCSPFCICNCCHSQIHQPGYFQFQAQLPAYADLNSMFQQHSLKFVTQSIWQPPRLS